MRDSLQQKSGKTGMENIAAVRTHDRPPQNNLWLPVFSPDGGSSGHTQSSCSRIQ